MTEDNIYPLLSSLADGRVYPYVVPLEKDGSPSVPHHLTLSFLSLLTLVGMCFVGQQNQHSVSRLTYGLKAELRPGLYALRRWKILWFFHLRK